MEVLVESTEPNMAQVKSHSAMAKAISKILNHEDKDKDSAGPRQQEEVKPEARTAKVTSEQQSEHRTVTARKRKRVESGDSERTTSQRNDRAASQRSEKVADVVELCHVLPRDAGLEGERALQRVATQAVVQLFNAVSKHQKDLEAKVKEAGKSEHKKTKVLASTDKKDFISHLGGLKAPSKTASSATAEPSWSVLRDDFVKGSKFKDWDKE